MNDPRPARVENAVLEVYNIKWRFVDDSVHLDDVAIFCRNFMQLVLISLLADHVMHVGRVNINFEHIFDWLRKVTVQTDLKLRKQVWDALDSKDSFSYKVEHA